MEKQKISKKNIKNVHPKDDANFISHFFFCWQILYMVKWIRSPKNDFTLDHVESHDSFKLGSKLEKIWNGEINLQKKPSLVRALLRVFGLEFLFCSSIFSLLFMASNILQIFYLKKLLDSLSLHNSKSKEILIYAGFILFGIFLRVFATHFFCLHLNSFGMKIRIACCSLMYRKILTLKKSAMKNATIGQIISLMSNDMERFDRTFVRLFFAWASVFNLAAIGYLVFVMFGFTAIVGISTPIFCLLIQIYFFRKISTIRNDIASKTDYRIRLISDVVNGIKAIKMYSWENFFENCVETARRLELQQIKKLNSYRLTNYIFSNYVQKTAVMSCILVAVIYEYKITTQYIFVLCAGYDICRVSTNFINVAVNMYSELIVSIQRIQEFLLKDFQKHKENIKYNNDCCRILLQNVSAKWDSSSQNYCLSNININLTSGLVAITGRTGSGKSTLLNLILKDLDLSEGEISVEGNITYAPQSPWIFSASIKENILFGEKIDEVKYRQVIRVCALEEDLALFAHGDNTLVGERGVMLSGGQKARINLARAVYRDADIYLLDDPLSAVDVHVADQIFKECILGRLKNKCVILVTHQLQYLKYADKIFIIENNKICQCDNYQEVDKIIQKESQLEPLKEHKSPMTINEDNGSDTFSSYKIYCFSKERRIFFLAILTSFVFLQILICCFDYFLSLWTRKNSSSQRYFTDENFMYISGILLLIIIIFCNSNIFAIVSFCTKNSKQLHENLFKKILKGSMKFFNEHPSGRILNRFSKDMGIIDDFIPNDLTEFIRQGFLIIGQTFIIMIVNFWMIGPTIILYVLLYFYGRIFQTVIDSFRRIEAIRRSPIFTHITATVHGLLVIKAFGAQNHVLSQFDNYQNVHSSIYYMYKALFLTLAFCVDFTVAVYNTIVIYCLLFYGGASIGANVGLTVFQSIAMIGSVQYEMKILGDVDTEMTSVERVAKYQDLIEEIDDGDFKPDNLWPENGKIEFRSVSMKYSLDKPFVLKNISFIIQPGEKIGIIGRTGAGKSSLISVLLRLFDFEGSILIDDADTKTIPLNTLRSKIAVIPQEPVLFIGTLRQNLDPFNEFTDIHLWNALEKVGLKEFVSNLPAGLECEISEGGSNFSVGQRQLFCLVRAVMKNSRIVALDEATANIDLETDQLVQKMLKNGFGQSTVLTIAHRLESIMDSDKILVMEEGTVVEFGKTEELLNNVYSYFYNYVNRTKK